MVYQGDTMSMYPLWNMVREKYPEARLVEIWGDSVEFRLDGKRWMAVFNDLQTKIEGVWDMSSEPVEDF